MQTDENAFLQEARQGRNQFWRYLAVNLAIIIVSLIVTVIITLVAVIVEGTANLTQWSEITMLLASMLPFPFALIVLWAGVRFIHGRPFISLVNPVHRIAWRRLFISAAVWFLLSALGDAILSIVQPGNYTWTFDIKRFFPYLLLGIILIPIQAATEELLFRAYLPQSLGLIRGAGLWLPLIGPAIVFGLLHGLNPEAGTYGLLLTMPSYIGMGLVLGWITLRSESLEMALGMHIANNLYAALVVTFPASSLTSPALFSIGKYDPALALGVWAATSALYLLFFYTLGRKLAFPPV